MINSLPATGLNHERVADIQPTISAMPLNDDARMLIAAGKQEVVDRIAAFLNRHW